MGYNIGDVSGNGVATGGNWAFTLDLSLPGVTTVSGDFDRLNIFGASIGEASAGYSLGPLSTTAYGTITAFNATTGTFTFTVNKTAVITSGSDQTVTVTITGSGGGSDSDVIIINILVCVVRGTMIRTDRGEVPVEELVADDMVHTLDGPAQPARWIGKRHVSASELAEDPGLLPILISPGALGGGQPERELCVSPQHRIFRQDALAEILFGQREVLVPAKSLVNDDTIRVGDAVEGVDYFHILFDHHEIMFTNGAPTESFHPGEWTMGALDNAVREELLTLFPELGSESGERAVARPCLRVWESQLLGDVALPEAQELRAAS